MSPKSNSNEGKKNFIPGQKQFKNLKRTFLAGKKVVSNKNLLKCAQGTLLFLEKKLLKIEKKISIFHKIFSKRDGLTCAAYINRILSKKKKKPVKT